MSQACPAHDSPPVDEADEFSETSQNKPGFFKRNKELFAVIFAGVSMLAAMPEMLGYEKSLQSLYISAGASLIVILFFGLRFIVAIPKIFTGANMNTLVGLGIVSAYGLSIWQYTQGNTENMFFDSAAFVAAFVLAGQWVEGLLHQKIRSKLPELVGVLPQEVSKLINDVEQTVNIKELKEGDLILVPVGSRIPADAELVSELATLDESVVTGESKPVSKNLGQAILQGSINVGQPIKLKVKKPSAESYYHGMIRAVRKTLSEKPPVQKRADTWSKILAPLALVIAAGVATYWYVVANDSYLMINTAVSVLVITCPCALGIATPLALLVSVIKSGKLGFLLKNLEAVERSPEVTLVAFDKTGTLTQGVPEVTKIYSIENVSHQQLLQFASALELYTEHPYGKAIQRKANSENAKPLATKEVEVVSGKGIRGKVEFKNKQQEVCLGNLVWLFENGVDATSVPDNFRWEAEGSDDSVIWMSVDGKIMGIFLLSDPIREEASEVVKSLGDQGLKVGLITGDAENVATRVAKELKLNFFHYGVAPDEKATLIRRLSEKKKKGIDFEYPKVAYVGDGINDGPALAESHLGIAMGSGTALAQVSADVILVNNRLTQVPKILESLRKSNSLIQQNLALAFIYNLIAIPVAAGALYPLWGVYLNPSIAAIAMSASSLSVLVNSLRSL